MAEIQIKVTVPDGDKCDLCAHNLYQDQTGDYTCGVFLDEVEGAKLPQCITATILPDKSPNECEVCGRPKTNGVCGVCGSHEPGKS